MTTTVVPRSTALAGRVGVVGGLLGALQALALLIALLLADPADADRFSHPLPPGVWSVAQVTFFVQHLLLVPGVLALIPMLRDSRLAVRGLVVTAGGVVLLALMELYAITAASSSATDPQAELVSSLYGVPTIILGVALTVAGIGAARLPLAGWRRWILLASGIYVFVVLLPAIFGPAEAGRIAIGVWMLMFAAMGHMAATARRRP
jgi:hypothetical protein